MENSSLIMLPKLNRLKKRSEIEKVLKKGKKFKEDFLILKLAKNNLNKVRFVCVVSQKISKKATLRNKIRRRLNELIRLKIKRIKKGTDAVLLTLPGLEKKDFWEMEEILTKLFEKGKII